MVRPVASWPHGPELLAFPQEAAEHPQQEQGHGGSGVQGVGREDGEDHGEAHVCGDGEPELDAGQEEHVGVAFREAPGPALPRGLVTELPVLEGQPPVQLWPQRHNWEERQLQEEEDHDQDSESV